MAGNIRDVTAYTLTTSVAAKNLRDVSVYALTSNAPATTLTLRKITGYAAVGPAIARTLTLRKITAYAVVTPPPEKTLTLRKVTGYAAVAPVERTLTLRKLTGYAAVAPVSRTFTLRKITAYAAVALPERTLTLRKITGYAAVTEPLRTLTLRKITAYIATSTAASASVREVNGLALIKPEFLPPFHLPSVQGLLFSINQQHGTSFIEGTLQVGTPSVLVGDPYYDTNVTFTATEESGYVGATTFRYKRAAFDRAFFRKDLTTLKAFGATVVASLPAINAKYALNLQAADVVDGAVAAGATTLKVTISANSYYYLPGTFVTFGA